MSIIVTTSPDDPNPLLPRVIKALEDYASMLNNSNSSDAVKEGDKIEALIKELSR